MTQDELDVAIDKVIIVQNKPKSTGNSHKRKQWENRLNWRRCTIRQTCKLGSLKDYENLYKFYGRFPQYLFWVMCLKSPNRKLSHVTYDVEKHRFK